MLVRDACPKNHHFSSAFLATYGPKLVRDGASARACVVPFDRENERTIPAKRRSRLARDAAIAVSQVSSKLSFIYA